MGKSLDLNDDQVEMLRMYHEAEREEQVEIRSMYREAERRVQRKSCVCMRRCLVEENLHASLHNQFGDFFIPLIRHLRPHVHCLA